MMTIPQGVMTDVNICNIDQRQSVVITHQWPC